MGDRRQHRRRRQIAIPDVVFYELVVPSPLPCGCIEYKQAVGKQVRSLTVAPPEVERRAARWQEHEAAGVIDGDTAPRIRAAHPLPRIRRPGVVAELARPWNGVKDPAQLARPHIEGADMAR